MSEDKGFGVRPGIPRNAAGIHDVGRLEVYYACKGNTGRSGELGLPTWQFYEEFDKHVLKQFSSFLRLISWN